MKRHKLPRDTHQQYERLAGFTLVELMITLVILVILLTIAVPSFERFFAENRAASGANEILTGLHLARSEAVRRNSNASLCPSTNGETCTGGTEWARGWIVFHDVDGNGGIDLGDDAVLRVSESLSPTVSISGPEFHTFVNSGVSLANTFDLSVSNGNNPQRCVEVIVSGASRVLPQECL